MPDFDPTDEILARKLGENPPPPGLRERLLAIEPAPARTTGWWARGIAAAAAVLVVVLMITSLLLPAPSKAEPLADATSDMAKFLSDGFSLEMRTADVDKVRGWLAKRHPNRPVDLPAALAQNRALGCRDLLWRGHVGSLACFAMKDGREAHLAMFPEKAFSDAPGSRPQIASAGAWTTAAWSKDGMSYILFVPEGMDPMAELLAQQNNASSSELNVEWPAAKVSAGVARISSALET
jgi:hypothetical protein